MAPAGVSYHYLSERGVSLRFLFFSVPATLVVNHVLMSNNRSVGPSLRRLHSLRLISLNDLRLKEISAYRYGTELAAKYFGRKFQKHSE
jgi:hypothetical protein